MRKDQDVEENIETCTYMIWCKNYKYCKALSENGATADVTDGKHSFVFVAWENIGVTPHDHKAANRDKLISLCNNGTYYYCSSLIEYDGWEIKDDYPVW